VANSVASSTIPRTAIFSTSAKSHPADSPSHGDDSLPTMSLRFICRSVTRIVVKVALLLRRLPRVPHSPQPESSRPEGIKGEAYH
jgi:hypothetical protein